MLNPSIGDIQQIYGMDVDALIGLRTFCLEAGMEPNDALKIFLPFMKMSAELEETKRKLAAQEDR